MNTSLPQIEPSQRNLCSDDVDRRAPDVLRETLAYRSALYDFGEGLITWRQLVQRHQAVRSAIRAQRRRESGLA